MVNRHHTQAFEPFVEKWLPTVHCHAALAYPLANTNKVVIEVFGRVAAGIDLSVPPTVRAGLFRLVRLATLRDVGDVAVFRRRNADAVAFSLRDAASALEDTQRLQVEATVEAMQQLSVDHSEILRLTTIDDLTHDELAWVLDVNVTAATAIAHAATESLRNRAGQARRIRPRGEPL